MSQPTISHRRHYRLLAAALAATALFLVALAPRAQAAVGDFHTLAPTAQPATSVTVDPTTNLIYAQENGGTDYYRYDPRTNEWSDLADAPLNSGNNGGAAYLAGKIYTVYTGNDTQLGVYDIASNSWTTIANPLGEGTGNITAVGDSLYLAVRQNFVRYTPGTGTTTPLANPPAFDTSSCSSGDGFEEWGGLEPLDGKIYGHEGNGCSGFAVYDIASNSWTELPLLPDNALLGSAIDPVARAYYTYGDYNGESFYRYDIDAGAWTTITYPFNNLDDGGMAYISLPGMRGIYSVDGENGEGFRRFETPEPQADLSVTKTADPATTTEGNQITYTITVRNGGPHGAAGVTVTDSLPGNVDFVSASSTQGTCSGTTTVTCDIGALANGASATVTIRVTARSAGTATNTASVASGDAADPNGGNNQASATTNVTPAQVNAPRDSSRPRVGMAGVRSSCVRRAFRVRLTARDGGGIRRVTAKRDGRHLVNRAFEGSTRTSFTVLVKVERLRAGRHTLALAVRDLAGNRSTTSRSFRVCAAQRRAPSFTG